MWSSKVLYYCILQFHNFISLLYNFIVLLYVTVVFAFHYYFLSLYYCNLYYIIIYYYCFFIRASVNMSLFIWMNILIRTPKLLLLMVNSKVSQICAQRRTCTICRPFTNDTKRLGGNIKYSAFIPCQLLQLCFFAWFCLFCISLDIVLLVSESPNRNQVSRTKTVYMMVTFNSYDVSVDLCLTSTCISLSDASMKKMNTNINPCDDFYEYSCGRWIAETQIPEGFYLWGALNQAYMDKATMLRKELGTVNHFLITSVSCLLN